MLIMCLNFKWTEIITLIFPVPFHFNQFSQKWHVKTTKSHFQLALQNSSTLTVFPCRVFVLILRETCNVQEIFCMDFSSGLLRVPIH